VLVTGGVTPLDGLPGQTMCGEIDPSIVLKLAQERGWGPEQIGRLLAEESGLLGLTGRPTTLPEVFAASDPESLFAREVLQYRILQACGAGIAAMGGLDTIVFSGRFAVVGETLGPWLQASLHLRDGDGPAHIDFRICRDSLDRILADLAATVALRWHRKSVPTEDRLSRATCTPPAACQAGRNPLPDTTQAILRQWSGVHGGLLLTVASEHCRSPELRTAHYP